MHKTNNEIWVICEIREREVDPASLELIGKAAALAGPVKGTVGALLLGSDAGRHTGLLTAAGADRIYLTDHSALSPIDDHIYAQVITRLARQYRPSIILMAATIHGRSIAPQVAARLSTGLTADCTELALDEEGLLIQTRPAFGGGLMARIVCRDARPQMATVRPGVMPYPVLDYEHTSEIIPVPYDSDIQKVFSILTRHNPKGKGACLHDAQVIVAGGKGVGSKEAFSKLDRLAALLGGTIGASRSAVDAGYAPYDHQIGQTGVTVRPRVYIACGISGSVQHLAGMSGSEHIIAVNTDPKAPIFDYADYGIVGDLHTVLDEMIRHLESR